VFLRPDLVEVIHRLRQEHWGAVDDDEFPGVAGVRTVVAEADLPAVLAAAFGRNLDGTPADDVQAPRAAHSHETRSDPAGKPSQLEPVAEARVD
jgi:hypothetical protein